VQHLVYGGGLGLAVYNSPFSAALQLHSCKLDVVFYQTSVMHTRVQSQVSVASAALPVGRRYMDVKLSAVLREALTSSPA
jgi:hypothetical protein